MTPLEPEQSTPDVDKRLKTGPTAADPEPSLLKANMHATVRVLNMVLDGDNPTAQQAPASAEQETTDPPSLLSGAPKPHTFRQGLFAFPSESAGMPGTQGDAARTAGAAASEENLSAAQQPDADRTPLPGDRPHGRAELFGFPVSSEPKRTAFLRGSNGDHLRGMRARLKTSRNEPSLFDRVPDDPVIGEPPSSTPLDRSPPISILPADSDPLPPADPSMCSSHPLAPDSLSVIATGEKSKARDILAAIRTLKGIEQEQRPASAEERQALARFAGFGPVALSIFPDPVTDCYRDTPWQAVGEELKQLLTPEEYASAKRTTFNAFYTSPTVIAAMHEGLARLGVPGNATILEPGCGVGNFMGHGPAGMRFIGIELDSISGRIAQALHPDQQIRIENFRDARLPEDSVDGVIGNVPFADVKLEHRGQTWALHDFFFAKSVDALKPGGALALVTTHYTLDKQNAAIREYLGARADFVGAIRLPSDAFKREGTRVVTDIIFLRKRAAGETANHVDPAWLGVAPLCIEGADISINRYFLNRPAMVLGTWSRKDTLYGGEDGYSLLGNGDLAEQLRSAIRLLPEYTPAQASAMRETPQKALARPPPAQLSEGSFFVDADRASASV